MAAIVDSSEMILFCEIDSKEIPVKLQGRGKPSKATKDGNSLCICTLELEIFTENLQ